jgi:hypothetical protein
MNPLRKIDDYLMELGEKQRRLAARNRALKPVNQMTKRQFNRRIEAQMPVQVEEMPLADRLLQMEKTNTLVNNRLDRLTPEQKMRSLPLIARDYQDFLRQSRMQEAADSITMGQRAAEYGVPITAAAVAGGIGLANALQQEEPEADEPLTLDDFAWIGESSRSMDPADAMPVDEIDLGDFPGKFMDENRGLEPEVYIEGDDVDLEELGEMLKSPPPVVPDIDGLLDEDPLVDWTRDPLPGLIEAMEPVRPPEPVRFREPFMTNAQRRTSQVLMNAGIPQERAVRISLGQASLSPEEYRAVTGGRR